MVVSKSPEASLEEKVEFLLDRDQQTQRALNALRERLAETEKETPRQLTDPSLGDGGPRSGKITAALDRYRPVRFLGAVALTLGLGCTTAAAFVA
jgi:hypothetical protein